MVVFVLALLLAACVRDRDGQAGEAVYPDGTLGNPFSTDEVLIPSAATSEPGLPALPELNKKACADADADLDLVSQTLEGDLVLARIVEEVGLFAHDHQSEIFGTYLDAEGLQLVIVVAPEAMSWARTQLPALIEGIVRRSPIKIAVQEGCHDLADLRSLREAIRNDPIVLEAMSAVTGPGGGIGFGIDSQSGKLTVILPGMIDWESVKAHLLETYGVDRIDVDVLNLGIPDRPAT